MKLNDIFDMEEYLQNRCYCTGEIYETNGIFCRIFDPEDECKYFVKDGTLDGYEVTSVICKNSIVVFYIENKTISDAFIADATDNNLRELEALLTGKVNKISLDSFNNEASKKLNDMVDGVMKT